MLCAALQREHYHVTGTEPSFGRKSLYTQGEVEHVRAGSYRRLDIPEAGQPRGQDSERGQGQQSTAGLAAGQGTWRAGLGLNKSIKVKTPPGGQCLSGTGAYLLCLCLHKSRITSLTCQKPHHSSVVETRCQDVYAAKDYLHLVILLPPPCTF